MNTASYWIGRIMSGAVACLFGWMCGGSAMEVAILYFILVNDWERKR